MKIADKIILVTGGANGIGKALCERFHADGAAKIYVADIDFENAERVAESVSGKALRLDVADEANCRTVVEEILKEAGRIDFIASNAGIGGAEGSLEVSNKIWQKIYEINVLSHVYLARAAFPSMLENGGAFLMTASAAGLLTHPTATPYVVSKHAAVALAESFSIEFADQGIYVSCLCPQGVRTNLITGGENNPNSFLLPESISAEECADAVVKSLEAEEFLILPHAEVAEFIINKAENRDRWLHSLRKIRGAVLANAIPNTASTEKFFRNLYDSFNRRDIEATLSAMASDVKWANGMEGGFVHGRDQVREYWTRQFTMINGQVNPLEITSEAGKTVIKVHQIVKDLEETLISDSMVEHIFHLENGLVKIFEIGKADENLFKL